MKKKFNSARQENTLTAFWTRLQTPEFKRRTGLALGSAVLSVTALLMAFGSFQTAYDVMLVAAALTWVVWTLPNIELGLAAALFFAQPLFIPFGSSDFTLPKISLTVIAISAILIYWAFIKLKSQRADFQLTSLILPGVLVILSALISLINSSEILASLQYVFLILYFALLGLYLTNIIKNTDAIRLLAGALLTSLSLSAVFGLLQYFGLIPGYHGFSVGTEEIGTTLGNRNYLAACLAYLYPLGLFLLIKAKTRLSHLSMQIALPLIIVSLIAIDSDSAWLATSLGLVVFIVGIWLTGQLPTLYGARWRILTLVAATLALAGIFLIATLIFQPIIENQFGRVQEGLARFSRVALLGPLCLMLLLISSFAGKVLTQFRCVWLPAGLGALLVFSASLIVTPAGQAVTQAVTQLATQTTSYLRAQFWLIGFEMFKDHPITGIGLGDYKREYLPYKAVFEKTGLAIAFEQPLSYETPAAHAHNEYVQIGAEQGLLGLLALAAFVGLLIARGVRAFGRQENIDGLWLGMALAAGIAAALVDAFFSFPLHIPTNALVIVFLIASLHSEALGAQKYVVHLKQQGTYALCGILLPIALVGSFFAYREWQADINFFTGQSLVSGGDSRGEAYLLKSVDQSLAPSQALYKLGIWYYNQSNLGKAKDYLERSLSRFGRMDSYFLLAIIYTQTGQLEKAQQYLDTLLSFNPPPKFKDQKVPYLRALIYNEQGDSDRAISILTKLIAAGKDALSIRLDLAEIYLHQSDFSRAKELAQENLSLIQNELQSLGADAKPAKRAELLRLQKRTQDFLKLLPDE